MFKVVKGRRAWWPVKWSGVSEDGKVVENKIEVQFHIHDEDEHAEIIFEAQMLRARAEELGRKEIEEELEAAPGAAGGDEDPDSQAARDAARKIRESRILSRLYAEFTQRIATNWRGIGGENGDPLKFDEEGLQMAMGTPGLFTATVAAYQQVRRGGKEIRAGN